MPLRLVEFVILCCLMTNFHDRLRMRTREELSLTDSAENRAFHDSIHRYRKLDCTNERINDSERLFLVN
jgi:cytochrome c-type biogenesis protein CcmH/NrfF